MVSSYDPSSESLEEDVERAWNRRFRYVEPSSRGRGVDQAFIGARKVSGRSDDNLETIKSRLDVYHTQTAPLADYYVGEGKHVAIKGMGTIEEIFGRIKEAVNNVK